jgi:hypothetical protein
MWPVRALGCFGIESVPQSGPARVQYLMGMTGFEIIESLAALGT